MGDDRVNVIWRWLTGQTEVYRLTLLMFTISSAICLATGRRIGRIARHRYLHQLHEEGFLEGRQIGTMEGRWVMLQEIARSHDDGKTFQDVLDAEITRVKAFGILHDIPVAVHVCSGGCGVDHER